jgi:hypothetical protein
MFQGRMMIRLAVLLVMLQLCIGCGLFHKKCQTCPDLSVREKLPSGSVLSTRSLPAKDFVKP